MEIIKIYQGKLVDARELHQFLESRQDFSTWIKSRIKKYDFIENEDYILAPQNYGASWGGQNKVDYLLTLNMAKELAMVENTEKGKAARRYFIQCEKTLVNLKENKRLAAFMKLETTKERFKSMLSDKGLGEQDYIEIDMAGKKVLMNGKVVDDTVLQSVLLSARDFATNMTHHHTLQDELSKKDEIKNVNEENHIEVRKALLNKNIVPENLPQQDDIKKLQNGGEEGEQET